MLFENEIKCDKCGLHKKTDNIKIDSFIPENTKIEAAFITEIPLTPEADLNFKTALASSRFDPANVMIGNIIRCVPSNNRAPSTIEVSKCFPYLLEELTTVQPKVIVCLGLAAAKQLLKNKKLKLGEIRGRQYNGRPLVGFDCIIISTWHPNPKSVEDTSRIGQLITDFRTAKQALEHEGKLKKEKTWTQFTIDNYASWEQIFLKFKDADHITFDLETTGLEFLSPTAKITNVGLTSSSDFGVSVICDSSATWIDSDGNNQFDKFLLDLKWLMDNKNIIAHYLSFDAKYMKKQWNIWPTKWYWDTCLAHAVLKPGNSNRLKDIAWQYTDMGGYEYDLIKHGGLENANSYERVEYNIDDLVATNRIAEKQIVTINKQHRDFLMREIVFPAADIMAEMEYVGVKIDEYKLAELHKVYSKKIKDLKNKMYTHGTIMKFNSNHEPFNPNSSSQLGVILFHKDYCAYTPLKHSEKTGKPSCDKYVLTALKREHNSEICSMVLEHSAVSKLFTTYINGMRERIINGRVHTTYHQDVAVSGRTSSCVAKGTMIDTVRDLSTYSDGIPIENVKIGDYVYCYDDNRKLAIKKVRWAGKTGTKKVIRVHWVSKIGSGKHFAGYIDVTPEHKIRLIDGNYIEAEKLKPNDRVLSLTRLKCGKYRNIRETFSKNRYGTQEHTFIYEQLVKALKDNEMIHHNDQNPLNNSIYNLTAINYLEHKILHNKLMYETKTGVFDSKVTHRRLQYTKYAFLRMIAKAKGKITKMPHHFTAIKRLCNKFGYNLKSIRERYDNKGMYISRGRLQRLVVDGKTLPEISYELGFKTQAYYRIMYLFTYYGIDRNRQWANQFGVFTPITNKIYNHVIIKIEYLDNPIDVYNLEVEEFHNFIANGICIKNSRPNLQNIPKDSDIKSIFIPDPGYRFVDLDYKQMELVVSAYYTDDDVMKQAILSGDAHEYIAKLIFGMEKPGEEDRRFIKTLNFGVLYGMGAAKLADKLEVDVDEAKRLINEYFKLMQNTKIWIAGRRHQAERDGFVMSKFGRVRYYKSKQALKDDETEEYNSAVNHPIQSLASDLVMCGIIQWKRFLVKHGLYFNGAYIAMQVHDSVTSCIEEKYVDKLIVAMRQVFESIKFPFMTIPLTVDIQTGYDWGNMQKIHFTDTKK